MKKILFLFVLVMCTPVYAQIFPVDTAKLNEAYRALEGNPNSLGHQQAFLEAFPNTWETFYMTYRYDDSPHYDLSMYHMASSHILALKDKITLVSDTTYCDKLISVSVKGWLSTDDGPSLLQTVLHQVMWEKMDEMFERLGKLRKGHQMQFWQFYWSSMFPSRQYEEEFGYLYKLNHDVYPKEAEIMKVAFEYFYGGVNLDGIFLYESEE